MTRSSAQIKALVAAWSQERLSSYLARSDYDINRALDLYEANVLASEAFYTGLHALEICLRNRLDQIMTNAFGPYWFQTAPDLSHETKRLSAEAIRKNSSPDGLGPPGKVVADLSFAYWVNLLGPAYDATYWRQHLYKGFVRAKQPRKNIHGRFNAVRRLRNRIAHYEPIIWRSTPLEQAHQEILEAIGWICPDTSDWTRHMSSAPYVLAKLP